MSLKNFHLVFIALAALCCLGFAAWTFWLAPAETVTSVLQATAISSVIGGIFLVGYGIRFFQKAKDIIV